jgi:hypothetical protein
MHAWRSARATGVAGLSAVGAVLGHAGLQGLTDARWLALAAAGGALTATAIGGIAWVSLGLRRRSRRVARGDLQGAFQTAIDNPPLSVLIATMLVCQGGAHLALLAAGVPPHTGPVLSPLIHIVAAIVGALLLRAAFGVAERSVQELAHAIAAALRLIGSPASWSSRPAESLAGCAQAGRIHGRAPPLSV